MKLRFEHIVIAIALPLIVIGLALAVAGFPAGLWISVIGICVPFVPLVGFIVLVLIERLRR